MSPRCWGDAPDPKPDASQPGHAPWRSPAPGDRPHWSHWRGAHGHGPPWHNFGEKSTRRVYVRRFLMFLSLVLLVLGGWVAGLAYLFSRLFGGGGASTWLAWAGGVGLVLAVPILAMALAARVFRGYALPLAELIDAAAAVADGDLSVRVAARGSPDFQRLADSFNHMIEELARSDQQRRNLTADVAHELRTPLHIIRGNLEGVLDGVYAPTPEHIEATLQETRALARLVDDLRTLSLAEAGELPLECEPVDVGDLLADVVTSFSAQAETAGIDLSAAVENGDSAGTALAMQADAGRLDQVLSNLVGNALRHTRAGGQIRLTACREADRVRLRVADTGEGIAPEDLPFVFDRFWRADRARTHSSGASSGLGLAIAAQLVRAHGGTISVQSEVGVGTVFVLDLPLDGVPKDGAKWDGAREDGLV